MPDFSEEVKYFQDSWADTLKEAEKMMDDFEKAKENLQDRIELPECAIE